MRQWIVWKKHWRNIPAGFKLNSMKRFYWSLLFSVTGLIVFSQDFMLDKRTKIKNKMEKYYADNNRKYSSAETENSISFTLQDTLSLPATSIFYFNHLNRCIRQETIFSCDSCLNKSMQQSFNNKFIKWEKTGPETYYAGFPYHTLMEPVKINGQFILRYTWIKRKDLEK
jgi:hypothetical protein